MRNFIFSLMLSFIVLCSPAFAQEALQDVVQKTPPNKVCSIDDPIKEASDVCPDARGDDLRISYDAILLPTSVTKSRTPIYLDQKENPNQCIFIDATSSATTDMFIGIKSTEEFTSFLNNTPPSARVTQCCQPRALSIDDVQVTKPTKIPDGVSILSQLGVKVVSPKELSNTEWIFEGLVDKEGRLIAEVDKFGHDIVLAGTNVPLMTYGTEPVDTFPPSRDGDAMPVAEGKTGNFIARWKTGYRHETKLLVEFNMVCNADAANSKWESKLISSEDNDHNNPKPGIDCVSGATAPPYRDKCPVGYKGELWKQEFRICPDYTTKPIVVKGKCIPICIPTPWKLVSKGPCTYENSFREGTQILTYQRMNCGAIEKKKETVSCIKLDDPKDPICTPEPWKLVSKGKCTRVTGSQMAEKWIYQRRNCKGKIETDIKLKRCAKSSSNR